MGPFGLPTSTISGPILEGSIGPKRLHTVLRVCPDVGPSCQDESQRHQRAVLPLQAAALGEGHHSKIPLLALPPLCLEGPIGPGFPASGPKARPGD